MRRYAAALISLIALQYFAQSTAAADQIDRAIWISNAAYHISREGQWEYVNYLERTLNFSGGQASAAPWIHEADAFKQRMLIDSLDRSGMTAYALEAGQEYVDPDVRRANKVFEALKTAGPAGYLIGDYLQGWLRQSSEPKEMSLLARKSRLASETFQNASQRLTQVLGSVYDAAQANKSYADFIDVLFARRFAATLHDNADRILTNNPAYSNNRDIRELVRSTEATNEKIEKFKKSSQAKLQAEVDGLRGKTDEVINILDKERDLSAANATAIQETLAKALLNAEARRRAADAETTAEDLRATGRLLAILSPDRDFGRRIDLTTQAVTKFYTSIYGFEQHQLVLGRTLGETAGTGVATASLAYNWIGAFFTFAEAMSSDGSKPSALQITLAALRQISEQIDRFQKQMNDRFDRVDWELNQIHSELIHSFSDLSEKVALTREELATARRSIDRIALRIDAFERKTLSRLDLLISQRFEGEMQKCLGYAARTGNRLPKEKYNDCEGEIMAYLNKFRHPAVSGEWDASFEDATTLGAEIKDGDWPTHVNLLRGMAAARAGYQFPDRRANPSRWAIAASTFVDLATENPDHFNASPTVSFDRVLEEGNALSRELGWEISFKEPAKALKLYGEIVSRYKTAFAEFMTTAAACRQRTLDSSGSHLDDISPQQSGTGSAALSALATKIAAREILHAQRKSDEWLNRNKTHLIFSHPDTVAGNEGFPKILHPENIWAEALKNQAISGLGGLRAWPFNNKVYSFLVRCSLGR